MGEYCGDRVKWTERRYLAAVTAYLRAENMLASGMIDIG
jgi:hypothetical protein